jgi:isopenicillin-N epimerase
MARQHAVQRVMERNGIHFFETVPHALRRVAEQLGAFVRAPGGGAGISLVRNATMGVATVLRSMAFAPSDAILVFQFGYPAVKNLVHAVATQFGCGVVQVSVPQSVYRDDGQLVQCFEQHLLSSLSSSSSSSSTQKVRVAVFDHIVSSTGDVLPARALVEVCRRHGVLSLVDGAHAVGQLPLDLEALDADFYLSNCHKWLMTPKGCAFLYVREPHRAHVHPTVLSHGYLCGYAAESLWTATDDYSSFYALETSLQFVAALGFERMTTYNAQLCWGAAQMLAQAWGTEVYSPRNRVANLAVVRLPAYVQQQAVAGPRRWGGRGDFWGADAFRIEYLRDEWRIEVPVMCYADGQWYVRLAAQVYLEMADFELLRDAILALKNGELGMNCLEESLLTSS